MPPIYNARNPNYLNRIRNFNGKRTASAASRTQLTMMIRRNDPFAVEHPFPKKFKPDPSPQQTDPKAALQVSAHTVSNVAITTPPTNTMSVAVGHLPENQYDPSVPVPVPPSRVQEVLQPVGRRVPPAAVQSPLDVSRSDATPVLQSVPTISSTPTVHSPSTSVAETPVPVLTPVRVPPVPSTPPVLQEVSYPTVQVPTIAAASTTANGDFTIPTAIPRIVEQHDEESQLFLSANEEANEEEDLIESEPTHTQRRFISFLPKWMTLVLVGTVCAVSAIGGLQYGNSFSSTQFQLNCSGPVFGLSSNCIAFDNAVGKEEEHDNATPEVVVHSTVVVDEDSVDGMNLSTTFKATLLCSCFVALTMCLLIAFNNEMSAMMARCFELCQGCFFLLSRAAQYVARQVTSLVQHPQGHPPQEPPRYWKPLQIYFVIFQHFFIIALILAVPILRHHADSIHARVGAGLETLHGWEEFAAGVVSGIPWMNEALVDSGICTSAQSNGVKDPLTNCFAELDQAGVCVAMMVAIVLLFFIKCLMTFGFLNILDKHIIHFYTDDPWDPSAPPAGYVQMNSALRNAGGRIEFFLQMKIWALCIALSKLQPIPGRVGRRSYLPNHIANAIRPGYVFYDRGFLSTAAMPSMDEPENFFFSHPGDHVFIMRTFSGCSISEYSEFPGESEILFQPGSRFIVDRVETATQTKVLNRGTPGPPRPVTLVYMREIQAP